MKHTPGPWKIEAQDGAYSYIRGSDLIDGKPGTLARVLLTGNNFSNRNAHLIAAAPEMLEALEEFLRCGPHAGQNRDLLDQIEKTVKKAKGET